MQATRAPPSPASRPALARTARAPCSPAATARHPVPPRWRCRSDAALRAAVSTVDDIDAESGRITTVLALQGLTNGGRTGQYGIGQGAHR